MMTRSLPVVPPDADSAPRPRGEKRERILEASIQVFARKGFHKTRISDIAATAFSLTARYWPNS